MKFAAFFRNLNLGHGAAPSRAELESIFTRAGAGEAASFQTNGTVAFTARGVRPARQVLRAVQTMLVHERGFDEPVFLRDMPGLLSLRSRDPFAGLSKSPPVYDFYVTFLHDDAQVLPGLPQSNARGDVQVLLYTDTALLSVSHAHGLTMGSPNVWAEKLFGLPATTRTWGTLCRLLERHA
jgi:uncharacterized protein (DUF1697 family)